MIIVSNGSIEINLSVKLPPLRSTKISWPNLPGQIQLVAVKVLLRSLNSPLWHPYCITRILNRPLSIETRCEWTGRIRTSIV